MRKYTITNVTLFLGDVAISGIEFRADSDLNGVSPQFTLTCISTGGPVTNVTWTRNNSVTEGVESALTNRVTAQYTHTLTVTERQGGIYTCSVYNNKPSNATAEYLVKGMKLFHRQRSHWGRGGGGTQGVLRCLLLCSVCFSYTDPLPPFNVMAVQEGLTGIRVTWIPHPPNVLSVTGYRISYTGVTNGSVDVSHTLSHLIAGLHNGETYTVKVFGMTEHFSSLPVVKTVTLGKIILS